MFASGGALVESSSADTVRSDDHDHDGDGDGDGDDIWEEEDDEQDEEETLKTQPPPPRQERIIPGLDGKLYSLIDSHQLDMLPIDIQDIIDSPVTSCRPRPLGFLNDDGNDDEEEECGYVMAHRKTKTFAIDPSTGTVRWMQSPDNEGGGFTSAQTAMHHHHQKVNGQQAGKGRNGSDRTRAVLLQREDYAVRQVDIESGDEVWSVGMGKFSALDFDTGATSNKGGSSSIRREEEMGSSLVPDRNRGTRNPTSIRPRVPSLPRRSTGSSTLVSQQRQSMVQQFRTARATASAAVENNPFFTTKERTGQTSTSSSSSNPFFEPQPFPSIVFGRDGRSLFAVDNMTGDVLWRHMIESVVAQVYGVGSESRWVSLDVLEEEEDFVYPLGDGSSSREGEESCDGDCGSVEDVIVPLDEDGGSEQHMEGAGDGGKEGKEGKNLLPTFQSKNSLGLYPYHQQITNDALLTTLPITSYNPSHTSHTDPSLAALSRIQIGGLPTSSGSCSTWHSSSSPMDGICRGGSGETATVARIGRYDSTVFVTRTLQIPPGKDETLRPLLDGPVINLDPKSNSEEGKVWGPNNQYGVEGNDGSAIYKYEKQSIMEGKINNVYKSIKTPHGLFLTWQMVGLLVSSAIAGLLIGRMMYLKKKNRLPNPDDLLPMHTGKNEDEHYRGPTDIRTTPKEIRLGQGNQPTELTLEKSSFPGILRTVNPTRCDFKGRPSPPTRSLSLSALNSLSGEGSNAKQRFNDRIGGTDSFGETGLDVKCGSQISIPALNPASSETNTILLQKRSTSTNNLSIAGVSHVEGFPLLQYSRYSLEFKEISPLGKGGFGTVFKCSNTLDGREYAVKKVLIHSLVDSNGKLDKQFSIKLNRVLREVKILALLNHPNIVRYYNAWLEVETNDDETNDGEESASGTLQGCSKSAAIGFSSDLLVSNPSCRFPTSDYGQSVHRSFSQRNQCSSPGGRRVGQYSTTNYNTSPPFKENPLGWNSFLMDSSSLGSVDDMALERRQCFSKQEYDPQHNVFSSITSEEDLGFTWDRDSLVGSSSNLMSKNVEVDNLSTIQDGSVAESNESDSDSKSSNIDKSSVTKSNISLRSTANSEDEKESNENSTAVDSSPEVVTTKQNKSQKHILYIQMYLSQKTLLDYFEDRKKSGTNINIVYSLKMFVYIARGLKHVHEKGLIHRDLKPSNCFMDGSEVKIGDFGLSRESNSDNDNITHNYDTSEEKDDCLGGDGEITTQVGTSSYASPEQMNGSNYNSSTDIFSLGIILFELCYPMHTVR